MEYQKDRMVYKNYNWHEECKHRKKTYKAMLSEINLIQIIYKTVTKM